MEKVKGHEYFPNALYHSENMTDTKYSRLLPEYIMSISFDAIYHQNDITYEVINITLHTTIIAYCTMGLKNRVLIPRNVFLFLLKVKS